jgi:hypothetical protein
MLSWLWIMRDRLRDLGVITLILEQAWHSFPAFAAVTVALLLLLVTVLATAAATHSKAVSTETRLNNLVGAGALAANGRVSNLSGQNTSTHGLNNGQINGHTDQAGLNDGTINGSTGQINTGGGTAHTHGSGSLSVTNGTHQHGASATNGTLAVADGTHNHTLPAV